MFAFGWLLVRLHTGRSACATGGPPPLVFVNTAFKGVAGGIGVNTAVKGLMRIVSTLERSERLNVETKMNGSTPPGICIDVKRRELREEGFVS